MREIYMIYTRSTVSNNGNITYYFNFYKKSGDKLNQCNYIIEDLKIHCRRSKSGELGFYPGKPVYERIQDKIKKDGLDYKIISNFE